ncbi:MAG: IS4 family transposase [Rectinemataceae bacterium]|nr:IS4 family transposase [Rectinemataceae bacterium]
MPRRPKVDPEEALMTQIEKLSTNLPADLIQNLAKETGFVARLRKINPALFFWNLILGFGASMQKSLAALRKRYCTIAAEELAPSSFFDKFSPKLLAFLAAVLQHLLSTTLRSEMPRKILDSFKDVLIIDSTIVRLLDSLAEFFPGAGMPAGAKITTILSVATDNLYRMTIHVGKRAEVKTLQLGAWVKDHLLLFDMGYFKFAVFERIIKLGGHFITRLHKNADPKIVKVNRSCRGNAIDIVGKKVRDCLASLKREILDVMVEVTVAHRSYRGKRSSSKLILRMVGILNEETGEYHLYLTDLPVDAFSPEQIAELYRGRWFVELLFKELKSRYALDVIKTSKPEIVKALIYSAMITLLISRRLFVGYRDALARAGEVVTTDRWARFFVEYAGVILRRILRASGIEYSEELLLSLALRDTIAPDPYRERLEAIWNT